VNGSFTRDSLTFGPVKTEWKPADAVEHSGVYRVCHGSEHRDPGDRRIVKHQVVCLEGSKFPPCNQCGNQARFTLADFGEPIEQNEHFKKRARG
jgi:hypothetical protein